MYLRQIAASISVSALALVGLQSAAGAQISFHVSDTSITAGGSVSVGLDEPCLDGEGQPTYGNVIVSSTASPGTEIANHETKGDRFINGSGTFSFPNPGTYTISRFCDGFGLCSQVTVTVSAPATTTTTSTTTTTVAAETGSTTSTTTTTAPPKVEGVTSTNVAPTKAPAAERVTPKTVSYTG